MLLIRKNRNGEEFYGCERFPKCRHTNPMELNLDCPEEGCDGELDHTRIGGRRAIACSKCEFQAKGNVDKNTPCEACGNSWTLFKNKTKKKPKTRTCPVSTCAHEIEEIEEVEPAEEVAAESN
jgi:DNA topoisomerase-1